MDTWQQGRIPDGYGETGGGVVSINFEIITLDWERLADGDMGPSASGIYQVYGDSPIYGRDCLLYIGQASSLASRLRQHFTTSPITRVNGRGVRIARCSLELLDIAESILIATHKPSMNSEYINGPKSPEATTRPFLVQNHGDRGVLTLQVTNSYWL